MQTQIKFKSACNYNLPQTFPFDYFLCQQISSADFYRWYGIIRSLNQCVFRSLIGNPHYTNKYCVCGRELASWLDCDSPWLTITETSEQKAYLRSFQRSDFPDDSFQVLYEQLVYGSKHANFITAGQQHKRLLFQHLHILSDVWATKSFRGVLR